MRRTVGTRYPQYCASGVIVILVILIGITGCIQLDSASSPGSSMERISTPLPTVIPQDAPAPAGGTKSVAALAQKPDPTKIIITYTGGRDADQMMELQTTITDNRGTTRTQSMGSRLGTTPVQTGGTDTFYGPYEEKAHVTIIGHFADGTHQDLLDTWI